MMCRIATDLEDGGGGDEPGRGAGGVSDQGQRLPVHGDLERLLLHEVPRQIGQHLQLPLPQHEEVVRGHSDGHGSEGIVAR